MSKSLKRVLRVRALREEGSRMNLESEMGRLREIEGGAAAAAGEARESRERSFAQLARPSGGELAIGDADGAAAADSAAHRAAPGDPAPTAGFGDQAGWREAESAWEAAVWRRDGYEARRPEQQTRVERARGEFLADRRERLQAETLLYQAEARELAEEARRGQRALDDWFQTWARRVRGEKQI